MHKHVKGREVWGHAPPFFFLNSEAMRLLLRPLVGHTSNYTTQLWSHSCGIFETGSVSPDACALYLPGFH